jgi:hypothetical protein
VETRRRAFVSEYLMLRIGRTNFKFVLPMRAIFGRMRVTRVNKKTLRRLSAELQGVKQLLKWHRGVGRFLNKKIAAPRVKKRLCLMDS